MSINKVKNFIELLLKITFIFIDIQMEIVNYFTDSAVLDFKIS